MPFHTDIRFVYEIVKNGLQEIKDLEKKIKKTHNKRKKSKKKYAYKKRKKTRKK